MICCIQENPRKTMSNTSSNIVTRFAPSPTGYLHLGGARTALFNFLWARKNNGKFLLRIEDTDSDRTVDNADGAILDALRWLGMPWDNADIPYQSQRLSIYSEVGKELEKAGAAYWQDGALWLRATEAGIVEFNDITFGNRRSNANYNKQDIVLIRSNGKPLYNFSCVVDDHLTGVTTVIRGKDHLENTYMQLMIYKALSWAPPEFSHVPMMLANKKEKLSKRNGDVDVNNYKKAGFSPEGLLSYLIRFGWSHGDDELFSMEEMISLFDIRKVHPKDGIFDAKKCQAIDKKWKKKYATNPPGQESNK